MGQFARSVPREICDTAGFLRFSGSLRAAKRAVLAFTVDGRLMKRTVEVGDLVKAGQVLAKLDDSQMVHSKASAKASLAELTAQYEQVQRDLTRVKQLAAEDAATTEELEQISANADALYASLQAAKARLNDANRLLKETTIKAPYDAVVNEVYMEPGEFASPGKSIVGLSGTGQLELEVEVPESIIGSLKPQQTVQVEMPLAKRDAVSGTVKSVGLTSGRRGRLFPLVITLKSVEGLFAGMTAELVLEVKDEGRTSVPIPGVINPGGSRPSVFRVRNSVAERIEIEVGRLLGDRVTVQGALAVGDEIVIGGQTSLIDGDTVEVVK